MLFLLKDLLVLTLEIPEIETFDEETNEFSSYAPATLTLEHSLISISRWESKWKKPFLTDDKKTDEETRSYIECMLISPKKLPQDFLKSIPYYVINKINDYIQNDQTATTFHEAENGSRSGEIITSEIIYFWMVSYQIPFEAEKWPLGRLLALVRVCNIKNGDQKKMSKNEIMAQNKARNKARRAKYNTKG